MERELLYSGTIRPPFSDRYTELRGASLWIRVKKLVSHISSGLVLGGFFWLFGHFLTLWWLLLIGKIIGIALITLGFYEFIRAMTADCPYCGQQLGTTTLDTLVLSNENRLIECSQCHESLLYKSGVVRALRPREAANMKAFAAPLFEFGRWPNECIICGATPTHYEEARRTKFEVAALVAGELSIKHTTVSGIPYCPDHRDAVRVTIEDDYPRLVFDDYAARRRYVHTNCEFEVIKFRGTLGKIWRFFR